MASALEDRFSNIVREALTEPLGAHGFRKRGRTFVRWLDELAWVVDVQRSRYNSRDETQFTVNCGVFVPRVLSVYLRLSEPQSPTSADCCISARIGMLADDMLDRWWTLGTSPEAVGKDRQVVNDVCQRISLCVLPFLARFPSTREVAEYLGKPRPPHEGEVHPYTEAMALGCAGIVRLMRGEHEAARDAFALAVERASGTPSEDHIRDLEKMFLSGSLLA